MYCPKCGNKLEDNVKFCGKCGAKIDRGQSAETPFAAKEQSDPRQVEAAGDSERGRKPRNGKRWRRILLVIIICVAVVVVLFLTRNGIQNRQFRNHMDVGRAYLENEKYEEAAVEFQAAIAIDSKVVEPYIQLADAYQGLGETAKVEGTIDAARAMIVDTYERKGELPEDADDLYQMAVEEAEENEERDRAEKIQEEYDSMPAKETDSSDGIGGLQDFPEDSAEYVSLEATQAEMEGDIDTYYSLLSPLYIEDSEAWYGMAGSMTSIENQMRSERESRLPDTDASVGDYRVLSVSKMDDEEVTRMMSNMADWYGYSANGIEAAATVGVNATVRGQGRGDTLTFTWACMKYQGEWYIYPPGFS